MEFKITGYQFLEWYDEWMTFAAPLGLRLGQDFCNKFNLHHPELFYETDPQKSLEIIRQWITY